MRNYFLILILFSITSCNAQNVFQGYNLSKPTKFVKLPKELNEISGLDFMNDSTLVTINDEEGKLFFINAENGNIASSNEFGKDKDYEGICKANNTFFVLQSNGTITRIDSNYTTQRYDFKHQKKMDFEGLCFDKKESRLLVACKENNRKGRKKEFFIYAFDLITLEYIKKPFIKIDKKDVHRNFKPSGIAIHPNKNIYILSSFSKSLLVLSHKGKVLAKTQLNVITFHQPEGITFDKKGTLYISNERDKTYPTLLKFEQNEIR